MKKVLVPVDQGGLDALTLSFAKDFAINMGAQLELVSVLYLSESLSHPMIGHFVGAEGKSFMEVCEEVVANGAKQLADEGVTNVTTTVLKGDPASEIIDHADKAKCDLILIHTHGMGLVKRFAVGSVANTVVHHANVPVLVIK